MDNSGLIFILSSPSGAGKTTLSRRLLKKDDHLHLSVSMTTRNPRPSEVNGKDYFFVTQQDFQKKIKEGTFIEYARVFNHYYGTPLNFVESQLSRGHDVLFDVDWQGAQQIRKAMPEQTVGVFILPPSLGDLRTRLEKRNQEDQSSDIDYRMEKAEDEARHWGEYDYVIVNRDLDESFQQLYSILSVERMRRCRREKELKNLVKAIFSNS